MPKARWVGIYFSLDSKTLHMACSRCLVRKLYVKCRPLTRLISSSRVKGWQTVVSVGLGVKLAIAIRRVPGRQHDKVHDITLRRGH